MALSCVESDISANGRLQPSEQSVTPFLPDLIDPSVSYYYRTYNGTGNEWDDYSTYANTDGVEMALGVYGDNGSVMYHNAYGYAPYGPYSPAASPSQHWKMMASYMGLSTASILLVSSHLHQTVDHFTSSQATSSQGELSSSTTPDQMPLPAETAKGNPSSIGNGGVKGNNSSTPFKPTYQKFSLNMNDTNGRGILPGCATFWLSRSKIWF
ncbi:hypothetical protein GH714_001442 [Hevea brasiliensis]|uniref:Uncharacterized protein n=1 Tax=Hevea brasiliensis TaxID=3981 RepID=A0A6A6MBB5_HEVBR|nr:hypothetical protein GH714_001442 [Hevea brasiliensis]